ncbi:MAG: glycoside hydrolase [Actinomycetota bacterium]|nr:glycoside hydrolase [Actinomycetota bacterium]
MRRPPLLILAAVAAVVPASVALAATPASSSVTVPTTVGQTVTRTWTGTIPVGANPTSDCNGGTSTSDVETITVNVPPGAYQNVSASFTFSITWSPVGSSTTNDEILTVVGPNGAEVGSSDTSNTTETVTASDIQPGQYQVEACGFVNTAPQPYQGSLVIKTTKPNSEQSLPAAPANGLAFSPSVAADPQRDEAEPLIETGPDGKTYTCGPTGFTSASDYAQVSTDGGDQFHLLGAPQRGQQALGGGGDCAINLAKDRNSLGNYQYAYAGLDALNGFTTTTSADNGHTLINLGPQGNGLTDLGVLTDRQWNVFTDPQTVLLSYNQQQPRNIAVQKSTDGGLTYGPVSAIGGASPDFPGPMRTLPSQFNISGHRVVFFAWTKGSNVNLSVSYDNGASFVDCVAAVAPGGPSTNFATADADSAGNIYLAYAEKDTFHTYLVTLPHSALAGCNQPIGNNPATAAAPKNDPQALGFSTPLQVDRGNVRTTVFPWVAAEGAPGHVAVAFYGTQTDGNPNLGTFKASWNVYVNESLNALSAGRTFSQVIATTHPMHYDSICLNGLGCDLSQPAGDRSLADFFAVKYNPSSHRLQVVYDNDAKIPGEATGHVASPMVVTQIGGPSLSGGTISGGNRPVLRQSSTDPTGDALSMYSNLVLTPTPTNEPASDLVSTGIGSRTGGGFTVTMKLASLSSTDLAKALADTNSRSLLYVLRFTNGFQPSAVTARYNPSSTPQWTFKYNDYDTLLAECSAPPSSSSDKCLAFGARGTTLQGSTNVGSGTITMSVPPSFTRGPLLTALAGGQGPNQRPHLIQATSGSRFYDASAFTFGDASLADTVVGTPQTYLYPLDNTPAMDFQMP